MTSQMANISVQRKYGCIVFNLSGCLRCSYTPPPPHTHTRTHARPPARTHARTQSHELAHTQTHTWDTPLSPMYTKLTVNQWHAVKHLCSTFWLQHRHHGSHMQTADLQVYISKFISRQFLSADLNKKD